MIKDFFKKKMKNIKLIKNIKTKYNYEDLVDHSMAIGCVIFIVSIILASLLVVFAIIKWAINYIF